MTFPTYMDLVGHTFPDVDGNGLTHRHWMANVGGLLDEFLSDDGTTAQIKARAIAAQTDPLLDVKDENGNQIAFVGSSALFEDSPNDFAKFAPTSRKAFFHDGNNLITWVSRSLPGNGTEIVIQDDGPNTTLSISEVGNTLTVHLGTDGGDVVTTTAQELFDIVQLSSTLVAPVADSIFVGSDSALAHSLMTLSGGLGNTSPPPSRLGLHISRGGSVAIYGGDPGSRTFQVIGAEGQTSDLLDVLCTGYGISVNAHGTLITTNDDTNPCVQTYANDGNDLAWEIDGTGHLIAPMLPTSDPHIAGAIWSSSGVLHVSAG